MLASAVVFGSRTALIISYSHDMLRASNSMMLALKIDFKTLISLSIGSSYSI